MRKRIPEARTSSERRTVEQCRWRIGFEIWSRVWKIGDSSEFGSRCERCWLCSETNWSSHRACTPCSLGWKGLDQHPCWWQRRRRRWRREEGVWGGTWRRGRARGDMRHDNMRRPDLPETRAKGKHPKRWRLSPATIRTPCWLAYSTTRPSPEWESTEGMRANSAPQSDCCSPETSSFTTTILLLSTLPSTINLLNPPCQF